MGNRKRDQSLITYFKYTAADDMSLLSNSMDKPEEMLLDLDQGCT